MTTELIISKNWCGTRIALLKDKELIEFLVEHNGLKDITHNIYRGKVVKVLPGMQAAFVDIGLDKTGYLPASAVLYRDSFSASPTLPIEVVLKEGAHVIVQVVKDLKGDKGPRLTSNIVLPGRYLLYIPFSNHIGVSRKILDPEERMRLESIISENISSQCGVIIRTSAKNIPPEKLIDELKELESMWAEMKISIEERSSIGIIYGDLELAPRAIRDIIPNQIDRIFVDDIEVYNYIKKFVAHWSTELIDRIEFFSAPMSIFDFFGIEEEISRLKNSKIWLKSGGFIVIEHTVALTAIDVNTGKFVSGRDAQSTIKTTNIEAAYEIARQIRLRNISGLIVIDFIDMLEDSMKEELCTILKEALIDDRAPSKILPMSELGIIEISRKRIAHSLNEMLFTKCSCCDGYGVVDSAESIWNNIFVFIKRKCSVLQRGKNVELYVNEDMLGMLGENGRYELEIIGVDFGVTIVIIPRQNFSRDQYEILIK